MDLIARSIGSAEPGDDGEPERFIEELSDQDAGRRAVQWLRQEPKGQG